MGINGLMSFLRKECPKGSTEVDIGIFKNTKIAVDISIYLYKYKAAAGDKWIESIIFLIVSLRTRNIHPIIIIDGTPPLEKTKEGERRNANKVNTADKAKNLHIDLGNYRTTKHISETLDKTVQTLNDNIVKYSFIREKLDQRSGHKRAVLTIAEEKMIEAYIVKLNSQVIRITCDDLDRVEQFCEIIGVQVIRADGEAEACATLLYKTGKVAAILSEDSDILTYGCDALLTKYNLGSGKAVLTSSQNIIDGLGFTHSQFVDFCIMCGTDYNSNMRGVGIMTAYKLIHKLKTLEAISLTHDTTCLNYVRGREIFKSHGGLIHSTPMKPLLHGDCKIVTKFAATIKEINMTNAYIFLTSINASPNCFASFDFMYNSLPSIDFDDTAHTEK